MIAKFLTFFGVVAAAAAIAVPVGPAPVAYAQAPAPFAYAKAPAPLAYAHAPAPLTYAQAPAPLAYAHAPAPLAYAHAPAPVGKVVYAEPEAPAHYQFSYSVHDDHSGDVKQQQEERAGDAVHGSYSLVQPDGVHRTVDYTADKVNGFNAVVRYEGTPIHHVPAKVAVAPAPVYAQAPIAKIAYAPAPVAKFAYAPAPVAKVAYAAAPAPLAYAHAPAQVAYAPAPVAKLAYAAAPVAKVAYSQNLGHVTFSSPVVSYQH